MLVIAHVTESLAVTFFPRRNEWLGSIVTTVLGFVLLYNDGLTADNARGVYTVLLAVMGQHYWAWGLIIFGVTRFSLLVVNGAWRKSPHFRALFSILACMLFWTIAVSFSQIFGIAMVLAWAMFVIEVFNALFAAGDAKDIDMQDSYVRGHQTK